MRYRDLARDRFRVPPSHPILAEVTIDPVVLVSLPATR